MTDKRPLLLGLLALVAVLALGGAYVFELSRGGQMRAAEEDFMARMAAEGRTLPVGAAARPVRHARQDDAELAAWYGASDPSVSNPSGSAAEGVSTEPEDNSFLIDDTRPFGAPMDPGPEADQSDTPADTQP